MSFRIRKMGGSGHTQYPVGKPLLRGSIELSKSNEELRDFLYPKNPLIFQVLSFKLRNCAISFTEEFSSISEALLSFKFRNRAIAQSRNSYHLPQQPRDQLRSALNLEFDEDVTQMELHSLFAHLESAAYVGVG